MAVALFVGTRKGAFILRSSDRVKWELIGPSYLGHTANHVNRGNTRQRDAVVLECHGADVRTAGPTN